jgi:hypothetical protein
MGFESRIKQQKKIDLNAEHETRGWFESEKKEKGDVQDILVKPNFQLLC